MRKIDTSPVTLSLNRTLTTAFSPTVIFAASTVISSCEGKFPETLLNPLSLTAALPANSFAYN